MRTAAGFKKSRRRSAQYGASPTRGTIQCSAKTTAPTGMRTRPKIATKPRSCITKTGKQAAIEVTAPAASVTFHRAQFGVATCRARPAR